MKNFFTRFLLFALLLIAVVAEEGTATQRKFVLGKLPKGPVPPSGGSWIEPPGPPLEFVLGKLPKGPIPPSGPSRKTTPDPPRSGSPGKFVFGKLPKGPIPPGGPSRRIHGPPPSLRTI
ncbi:proline-rich protein HaeIII subfamily 1-like [Sesamum indicum]|uniref:Proline-rich protein HaeIII subfamily 1-like n=1 Tax=Sesamum indicum TaxID=4182 RepID=A0A6I9T1X6_SESIN|nr:proline-rich protein HaeIII subfamily 1-like [Sesamum indicum]